MFIKQLSYALAILGAVAALCQPRAVAGAPGDVNVVASFNYQALITDGSGNPIVNATNLTFEFQIYSPTQCLLYDEIQPGISSDSTGLVSLNVGSMTTGPTATKRGPADPGFTMSNIIANNPNTTFPVSPYCSSPYTPAAGDARLLRVIVTESAGTPITLSPDVVLGSVPQAYVADTLQGLGPADFVQVTGSGANSVSQNNVAALVGGTDISGLNLHNHDSHNDGRYARLGVNNNFTGNLDTMGDVGIGTTSPQAPLDIEESAPSLRIGGTGNSGNTLSLDFYGNNEATNTASIKSVDNSDTLSFWTGGVQAMSVGSSQQVTFSSSVSVGTTLGLGQYPSDAGLFAYLSTHPGLEGTMWENSTAHALRYWDGNAIQTIANTNGVVASVSVTAPIMNTGSPTAPNIAITQANTAQGGYLSSTDWNTFNNKQNALTYVPVNKAGDTMTGTLNLPSNGLIAGASQLVVNGGNVGIGTTAPSSQLQVVAATATTTGQIIQGAASQSNDLTDWENNTGTVLSYIDSSGVFHGNGAGLTNISGSSQWTTSGSNIYNSNPGNVGIGTTTPNAPLDVNGAIYVKGQLAIWEDTNANTAVGATSLGNAGPTGNNNTAVGQAALGGNTGSSNVAVGADTLLAMSGGTGNIAIGYATMDSNGSGSFNTAIGYLAGEGGNINGFGNIMIGNQIGQGATLSGSNNILIGTNNSVLTPLPTTNNFLNMGNLIFATGMTGSLASPAGNVGIGTAAPGAKLDVNGALRLDGATSGYLAFQAPANVGTPVTWTLPNGDGVGGQILSTNGAGTLSWINPSGGSVTSVTATAPLTSSGGAAPNIAITQAGTAQGGYLSSTDWNTFSGKVSRTGDSMTGPLTNNSNSGSTALVIAQSGTGYAATFTGGNVGIGTTTPSALLHVVAPTAGTTGAIVQGAAGQANDLTDWENSAGAVLSYVDSSGGFHGNGAGLTGIAGSLSGLTATDILFATGATNVGQDANFTYSSAAHALGIGTGGTPTNAAHFEVDYKGGDSAPTAYFGSPNAGNNQTAVMGVSNNGTGVNGLSTSGTGVEGISTNGDGIFGGSNASVSGFFESTSVTNNAPTLVTQQNLSATGDLFEAQNSTGTSLVNITSNGNVGIGTVTPGALLHVLTPTSATKGTIVQGASGQTADLMDWENNAGTVLSFIGADGKFHGDGSSLANLPPGPWSTIGPNIYNSNAGNVGIGTTSPAGILDVEGAGAAVFDNSGGVGIGTTNPNNATLNIVSSTPDGILLSGTEGVGLMVTSAGNAGVEATGNSYGVWGYVNSAGGRGVFGDATGSGYGIYGTSSSGTSGFFQTTGGGTSSPTLVVQAGAGQTGDLTDWDNLSGTPIMYVDNGGNLNMDGNYVHNVANPAAAGDAVNKAYVNAAIGSANYLPLAGGTLTGTLTLPAINDSGVLSSGSVSTGAINSSGTLSIAAGGVPAMNITPSSSGNTVAVGNQFAINASGNVGIGTTAPAGLLDVEGAGNVIFNSGNVGIGTSNPAYLLDIENPNAATSMRVANTLNSGSPTALKVVTSGNNAEGITVAPTGTNSIGLYVDAIGGTSTGVYSQATQFGVEGVANTNSSVGVFGMDTNTFGYGVQGENMAANGVAIYGQAGSGQAVDGQAASGVAIYGQSTSGISAEFQGGVNNPSPTLDILGNTGQTGALIALNTDGANAYMLNAAGNATNVVINPNGYVGIDNGSPAAYLELGPSTGAVPSLVVDSGTLLVSAKAGAIEFDGADFYVTDANLNRRSIAGLYVGTSTANYTGSAISGYANGTGACNSRYTNAHMCTAEEMVRSATLGSAMPSGAWYSTGVAVSGSASADCQGWTQTAGLNAMTWESSYGMAVSCAASYPIACCK